ncbi:LysR family transcriptional regulator [Pseudonocardia kongjuensis]|uniref:LysR family transcriptional regulator n=1 Tax=Pseudonocardia kongjuensis TaxID=102227 RepID=A0ABP4IH67_9PSEU
MTLTQLSAFVLVARLGSVKAAADALSVSEPAVSQAIAALRKYLGDPLLTRGGTGMVMTAGGNRLLTIAAQMVALGAEAEAAVRSANGAPEPLRLIGSNTVVEFAGGPLADAFGARSSGTVEVSVGVAVTSEMAALVSQRLADAAIGPDLSGQRGIPLVSEPVFRSRMVVLGAPGARFRGSPRQWPWLVDADATDPGSDVARLLRGLGVPESRMRVFPHQTAAWDAAAGGAGVTPSLAHLAVHRTRRRELVPLDVPGTPMEVVWFVTMLPIDRRSAGAGSLRNFLSTPEAMRLLREPGAGVSPSRFRPPVYVTIWN